MQNFIGVVLAGGQSSRMGQNKSLMIHQGKRLVDIMADKLRAAGGADVAVSGNVEGYRCFGDKSPGEGPARAILGMAGALKPYAGALFVPVDMPLIKTDLLKDLALQKDGGFYEGHFLPVYIPAQKLQALDPAVFEGKNLSVWKLLDTLDIRPLPFPAEEEKYFLNVNTPEEYKKLGAV